MQRIFFLSLIMISLGLIVGFVTIDLLGIFNVTEAKPMSLSYLLSAFVLLSCLFFFYILLQKNKSESDINYIEKEANKKIIEEENIVSSLFEHALHSVAYLSLDGKCLQANKPFCELLGLSETEALTLNYFYLVDKHDLNDMQGLIQELIDDKIDAYNAEQQWINKNGEHLWVKVVMTLVRDDNETPLFFILQALNISMQKKAEERLRHMAYHDPLTGLPNRNKLEQNINQLLAIARRTQHPFGMLFLDLDRFKNINDTIGHEAGDILLQIVAERLKSAVRTTDLVARLGGDEFVILIPDVKKTEAVALIAEKILDTINKAMIINGEEVFTTTSIGISLYPYDGHNIQSLMKSADLALYRAKERGRNNFQFYTMAMTIKAQEKIALQNALANSLARNEFVLHYQPQMDLKSRKFTAIEALLRWKHKDFSVTTSNEIISLAEDTGLIIPVTEWILTTACNQLKCWHDAGLTSLAIAINYSARQFKQNSFIDDLLRILTEKGLSPQFLHIEVTEATIMQNPEDIIKSLYQLKDMGTKIVIDDFGTGYWSLNNLRRLSVDKIKIDKSFIRNILTDSTSREITGAIIAMAHQLGVTVLAEGVETQEQYEYLSKHGCDEIQGYYITQPLPDTEIMNFLKHPIPDAETIS